MRARARACLPSLSHAPTIAPALRSEQTHPDDLDPRVPHYVHIFHNARGGAASKGSLDVSLAFVGSRNFDLIPAEQPNGKTLRTPDMPEGYFKTRLAPGARKTFATVQADDPRNDCEIRATAHARLSTSKDAPVVRCHDLRVVVGCAPTDTAPIRGARRRLLGWVRDGSQGVAPLSLRETRDLSDDVWFRRMLEKPRAP